MILMIVNHIHFFIKRFYEDIDGVYRIKNNGHNVQNKRQTKNKKE